MPADHFSIRWTGVIKPLQTGSYVFDVRGDDGFRLWVNNQKIIDLWSDHAATIQEATLNLNAGQLYPVRLEFYEDAGLAEITFGWNSGESAFKEAADAAANSDVAIVCVGFNSNLESEGSDRTFALPPNQDSLINVVAAANPNTIVMVNAGGNVDMTKWISNIKGLLHAWYPGQEGGTAIAEILFGITNPSGKLPVTFEKRWEDNPVSNSYYDNGTKRVAYHESVFLGYRYYESEMLEPMFPFGFGLSYTSFTYSNLDVTTDTTGGSIKCYVSFDIKNTGTVKGAEVSQVYIRDIKCSESRPIEELKGFAKVSLNVGESKNVIIELDKGAFAFYKTSISNFMIEKGDFEVRVGASSHDIRLRKTINISNDYIITGEKEAVLSNDEILVYPIPARDFIIFRNTGEDLKESTIEIFNVNGRKVDQFSTINRIYDYPCSRLESGFYIARITTGNTLIMKKVIIER